MSMVSTRTCARAACWMGTPRSRLAAPPVRPLTSRENSLATVSPVSTMRKGVVLPSGLTVPSLMMAARTPTSALLIAAMMPAREFSPSPMSMVCVSSPTLRLRVPVPNRASLLLATPLLTDFCTRASDTTSTS